jgi:hypothetical protein
MTARTGRDAANDVIDVREPGGRSIGEPAACPACGGAGYLDHINLRRQEQREHCMDCGRTWTTSFAETATRH